MQVPIGERFGNYEVAALIGAGGMGAVYRAIHPEIGKVVAIKVLRPELARDDAAVARFFDEARAVNAIRNAGLVDIFDLGRRPDGTVFLVMEYLVGEDLSHLLKREGRLAPSRAFALVREVCSSVGAAHRRGIIHRDLKPQNLFVVRRAGEEHVKVLDFGTAKLLHPSPDAAPHTSDGVVIGTVQYMSPEQGRGERVDERADVYSLGCILYELLTGTLPFTGRNVLQVLAKLATETAEVPSRRAPEAGLSPAIDAVVMRALAKNSAERFGDTEELAAALAALDGEAPTVSWSRDPIDATLDPSLAATRPAQPAIQVDAPRISTPVLPLASTPSTGVAISSDSQRTAAPTTGEIKPPRTAAPVALATAPIRVDETSLLSSASQPLIDAESERKVVRVLIPVVIGMFVAGLLLDAVPGSIVDREVLGGWLWAYAFDTAAIVALLVLVVRTQQRSRARWYINRGLTFCGLGTLTVAIHLTGSLTSYDILYLPLFVIIDRLREDRSLARLTAVLAVGGFVSLVAAEQLGLLDYAPFYPGRISPDLVHDRGLIGLVVAVVVGATFISYRLVDFLASRVQRREEELRQLGRGLAGRVEEQVELLRRSQDLRRYVSPQLAEAIMRGEAIGGPGYERRRLTVVRVGCPAIARAAELVEPEEFAHLLNELLGRIADLAVAHGGTVDRFIGAELSVLFGAPKSAGPSSDALTAVTFAHAAVAAVRELQLRCETAGVEERPLGRASVHTGFATVGSFGSPTRLEYTAVGPLVEAASALLAHVGDDQVILSHATFVLVREAIAAEPSGESTLPGARHPLKLYRLSSAPLPPATTVN